MRFLESRPSSQTYQFFLPIGSGGGLHLQSSMFIGQQKERLASPDLSADEQLACHWKKVRAVRKACVTSRSHTYLLLLI